MTTKSTFSIITITLNNLAGLKVTQETLTSQTCPDYEWIVIDGGSSDGTADFLKTTNADWISEPDGGLFDAMNKGAARASGVYLLFMNAGDCFASPDVLEKIKAVIAEESPDFIYGHALETGADGRTLFKPARALSCLKWGMPTHHQAMLYRRDAMGGLRFDTSFSIAADYDFTARALALSKHTAFCPFPVCLFKSGGISQKNSKQGRKEQKQIKLALRLCSPPSACLIEGVQAASFCLKSTFPSLYWFLRTRR